MSDKQVCNGVTIPTIADAKRIAYQYRTPGVAILFVKNRTFGFSSYGMTRDQCRAMGKVADQIYDLVMQGEIEIPDCLRLVEAAD